MNIFRAKRKGKLKIKGRKFLLLVFFLIMSAFAWFTYKEILQPTIQGQIEAWNIEFYINDIKQENPIQIESELYPGMQTKEIEIKIKNNGTSRALITYNISNIKILGKDYTLLKPGQETDGIENSIIADDPLTNTSGISIFSLINDENVFPFTIKVENNIDVLSNSEGKLKIIVDWPAGDDTTEIKNNLDTKWGYDIGKFFESDYEPKIPMTFLLKINATQALN